MSIFNIEKVVSGLPETLEADTIYVVRVGTGIEIQVTDSSGNIAYGLNPSLPSGGTTGQLLSKTSDTDFGVEWVDRDLVVIDGNGTASTSSFPQFIIDGNG